MKFQRVKLKVFDYGYQAAIAAEFSNGVESRWHTAWLQVGSSPKQLATSMREYADWIEHLYPRDTLTHEGNEHATPVPEDHDEMLFGLRTVKRARAQP